MDVSAEYFKSTGDFMDDSQKAIALEEINKIAPSNVTTLEGVDPRETIMPMGGVRSETPFTDLVEQQRGVKLKGDETFGELMEKLGPTKRTFKGVEIKDPTFDENMPFDSDAEKLAEIKMSNEAYYMEKAREEGGIGSLFPKGKPGEIFDVDNSRREEVATFIKDMRKAGIKNKDIKDTFKLTGTDIEQGKRAATTLARAADMGADTKGKQELLSEFDEIKMEKGPRFFQEEYMGYDSFSDAIRAKASEINNAIVDDLDRLGVDDETVTRIVSSAREVMNRNPFAGPDEMLASIKQDLEIENIKYDVTFFENLLNEYRKLMRKPEPRFAYGGMI